MDLRDKALYHQIHPLKLAVDVSMGLCSTWLMWRHDLRAALALAFLPSIVTSALMIRFMSFERQRDSRLGRYVARHMTRVAEAVRLSGQVIMWLGAWHRQLPVVVVGFLVIVLGWTYSL